MTEQQFTYEVKSCCDRVLSDLYMNLVDRSFVEHIDLVYHDGVPAWVEFGGTKLGNHDKHALDILGRVVQAVCVKHNLQFINVFNLLESNEGLAVRVHND